MDRKTIQMVLDSIKETVRGDVNYLAVPEVRLEDGTTDKQIFRDVLTLAEEQQDELYPCIEKLLQQAKLL